MTASYDRQYNKPQGYAPSFKHRNDNDKSKWLRIGKQTLMRSQQSPLVIKSPGKKQN